MGFALAELAQLVQGSVVGDSSIVINGASTISAASAGEITLADNPKLAPRLAQSPAAAVVISAPFEPLNIPYILVSDVHAAFAKIVQHFIPPRKPKPVGISPQAAISPTAIIGSNVQVYPGAYIGDDVVIGDNTVIHSGVRILEGSRIGESTTLFPNVVLYENSIIGNRVLIHAGCVIGAYGFGYSFVDGKHKLSAQLGNVEIGDDVEIGACSTIDRGTYGPTRIGEGCKFDNHVMIGHNVRVGKHNLICSQAGIAGSASTGDYVVLAGQVGVRDHVHVGDKAMLGAKCGVMNDIPPGMRVLGAPAIEEKEQYLVWAAMYKLPAMRKKLIELERELAALSQSSSTEKPSAEPASSSSHDAD